MDINAELEEERRIINAATEGPWIALGDTIANEVKTCTCAGNIPGYGHEQYCGLDGPLITSAAPTDAEFIAHARTALTLRNAQLEAVLEIAGILEMYAANNRRAYEEMQSNVGKSLVDGRADAYAESARKLRRAIEEAGA